MTIDKSEFQFHKAVREQIRLLIGLAGPSGSGKTYTGMLLAKGLSGGKRFAMIDTENRRGSMYADQFDFDVCDLSAPYRPDAYSAAIEAADKAGYPVILVDSMSHEHAGEGGVLDWQEEILDEMVKRAMKRERERRKEWELEEAYKRSAWIQPKAAHKRMVGKMLQCRAHLIFCMRAEDKIDFKKDEHGKTKVVPMETLSGFKGWIPICDKKFLFELTTSFIFLPDKPGVPVPIKLQAQHRSFFDLNQPITEDAGRLIGEWAMGGKSNSAAEESAGSNRAVTERVGHARQSVTPAADTHSSAPSAMAADDASTPQGAITGSQGAGNAISWFKRIESASLKDLQVLKKEIKTVQFSDDDKKTAIALMTARHKQLTIPPSQDQPAGTGQRAEGPVPQAADNEPWI